MPKKKIILVLSPHTDDGELGCGATINRFIEEGCEVLNAVFSLCKDSLPEGKAPDTLLVEATKASAVLGLKQKNLLLQDYPVRRFTEHRQAILDDMIAIRKKHEPSIIFVPSTSDIHQDHKVIVEEAVRAFKNCTIYGYEMPWNNYSFSGNSFFRITKDNLAKKIAAIKAYSSQKHRIYMQPDFIKSLATVRGVQSGNELAECFETIRVIH